LHLGAGGLEFARPHCQHIPAVEPDPPRGGLDQPQQQATGRGFAAAAFTHQPEHLARLDGERDTVDCFDIGNFSLKQPAADGEILDEVCDL
jgi:hypothetical protein